MTDEPFNKNDWIGIIIEHRGIPVGTFRIHCRKGSRVINTKPLTAEQVETFDPDVYWTTPS